MEMRSVTIREVARITSVLARIAYPIDIFLYNGTKTLQISRTKKRS